MIKILTPEGDLKQLLEDKRMIQYESNYHVSYPQGHRHWSPQCEPFAGGDCLLSAMDDGWAAEPTVYTQEFWHAGMRMVMVIHFVLSRGEDKMIMPVISNPFVRRFIRVYKIETRPYEEMLLAGRRERDADALN